MKNINMTCKQLLLIIISLLLSGAFQTNNAQKIKWLHVTDLQSPISETGAEVEVLQNLEYGKIRLVIAIPKSLSATSISELMEEVWSKGKNFRVSTEYLNIAAEYLKGCSSYKKRFGKSEPLMVTPLLR